MEYPLYYRGDWHYDGIFITTDVLKATFRSAGIPVGPRAVVIVWGVDDPTLVVIMLVENGDPIDIGEGYVDPHTSYCMGFGNLPGVQGW